jgi:hypothetical protein
MKKTIMMLAIIAIVGGTACKSGGDKNKTDAGEQNTTTAGNTDKETAGADDKNDNRIDNVSAAKRPKGTMSYTVDGQSVTIDENQVQCMYVGMNKSMAQSVISGGSQVMILHMGLPKVGEVEIVNHGPMPSVGIQVIVDGVQYNNKKAADAKLTLTKVTPDGKNYYVAGTFSGTLESVDGQKKITVTDGVFESAYL